MNYYVKLPDSCNESKIWSFDPCIHLRTYRVDMIQLLAPFWKKFWIYSSDEWPFASKIRSILSIFYCSELVLNFLVLRNSYLGPLRTTSCGHSYEFFLSRNAKRITYNISAVLCVTFNFNQANFNRYEWNAAWSYSKLTLWSSAFRLIQDELNI